MRKFLQKLLTPSITKLAHKYDGKPDQQRVFSQLTELHQNIVTYPGKKGLVMPFDYSHKFIILSDQHKGAKDDADDFALAENNYLAALDYYYQHGFYYISLGDCEEFWENTFLQVKEHNQASFKKEKLFIKADRFVKIFGNHDLYWDNDPLASFNLKSIYGQAVTIYEGLVLQATINQKKVAIFLTHGHQGDLQSDGNWFSKWFVSTVWAPLQAYLKMNLNTPSNNDTLKSAHNKMMTDWVADQTDLLLITGHTHQPVFASLTHIESLYKQLADAKANHQNDLIVKLEKAIKDTFFTADNIPDFTAYKSTYFNSGCCCFDDGDITGIEIEGGNIRLVKWKYDAEHNSKMEVLEEAKLVDIFSIPNP